MQGKLSAAVLLIFFFTVIPGLRAEQTAPVPAHNAYCPVSGDKADPQVDIVYHGKKYNLCCKMCIKDFKKDPEGFIQKMEAKAASGSSSAPQQDKKPSMPMEDSHSH